MYEYVRIVNEYVRIRTNTYESCMYLYVYSRMCIATYHSWSRMTRLERCRVNNLGSKKIFVHELHCTEYLHWSLNLRNRFQAVKDLLDLSAHQLSVPAIRRRQGKVLKPVVVKINKEVDYLSGQLVQDGMLRQDIWHADISEHARTNVYE